MKDDHTCMANSYNIHPRANHTYKYELTPTYIHKQMS